MGSLRKVTLIFLALAFSGAAFSQDQSLGDVARAQRQKQSAQDSKDAKSKPKVITNEELPESPDDDADVSEGEPAPRNGSSSPASSITRSGDQWKTAILAQKNQIAAMQANLDKFNASIHFVEANRYRNGVQWNERQIQKQDQAQQMQKQLDEAKKKLEDMQEAARKQGFGNSVYDP
jgi:hypothetical protein